MKKLYFNSFSNELGLAFFVIDNLIKQGDIQQITATVNDNFKREFVLFYWK